MFAFLKPAAHVARLPAEIVRKKYPRLRWQILESTFIGYAFFYLVRNNLAPVSKEMAAVLSYSKSEIGDFLAATAIAYGVGKFLMGLVSDQSNPRRFMPLGLVLTALCNFAFGASADYGTHLALWTLNGLVQGMGWPPCGRSLGHWFSENERGTKFAIWNIAHNVGGGIAGVVAAESMNLFGWQYAFYIPGILALACAAYLYARLRDTPQSEGLPPIEEYRNDMPPEEHESHERELTTREILFRYVLRNKYLWIFAVANFFVYIARYSMLDWGPTYLKEVKGANILDGGVSTMVLEFAGIPSTILMGWISDRLGGRRGLVSFLCMIPIFFAFAGIALLPPGHLWLDMALFGVVGFFVYPPVMLLGVTGLDFTSKKAVGSAAGFIGLFGYLGRTVQGKVLGTVAETSGWNASLALVLGSTLIAIVLLAFTVRLRPRG